jgi:hypothetical protein
LHYSSRSATDPREVWLHALLGDGGLMLDLRAENLDDRLIKNVDHLANGGIINTTDKPMLLSVLHYLQKHVTHQPDVHGRRALGSLAPASAGLWTCVIVMLVA